MPTLTTLILAAPLAQAGPVWRRAPDRLLADRPQAQEVLEDERQTVADAEELRDDRVAGVERARQELRDARDRRSRRRADLRDARRELRQARRTDGDLPVVVDRVAEAERAFMEARDGVDWAAEAVRYARTRHRYAEEVVDWAIAEREHAEVVWLHEATAGTSWRNPGPFERQLARASEALTEARVERELAEVTLAERRQDHQLVHLPEQPVVWLSP